MARARQSSTVSDDRVARFMAQVYFMMAIGLLVISTVFVSQMKDPQNKRF